MIRFLVSYLKAWRSRRNDAPWRRPWDMSGRMPDDLSRLAAIVDRGIGCWAARERGECCTCGHEWIPGEIIGSVVQAYVRTGDGGVMRSPGTRLACSVCVEQQRVQGDLSLGWAQAEGML